MALDPLSAHQSYSLGNALLDLGRPDEARVGGRQGPAECRLAGLLARAGRQTGARRLLDEAGAILAELRAQADRTGIHAPGVAWVLLALDDAEGALAWLERSYQQKHPGLRFIARSPGPHLASDPRYVDLRRRIGLPQ